ncbi:MAG: hypothetical protein IJG36_01705, partial [Synergistaceae bacterium]|nr:hypothetical protein [Synergistaceae bacterium]
KKVDEVLRQAVQGVTDLITQNGFVNLDFADIKAILTNAGTAIMGMGEGEGEDRARKAAQNAMDSPLMTMPMTGATGVLLNVTTGTEITLQEMTDATDIIREKADQDAQVIWGHVFDETLGDKVRVTMIATFPEESGIPQGRVRISGRGENIQTPPTRPVTGQNVPLPQPPVQQPQPQPTVQTPPTPRRTLFTLYEQKRKQQESVGLEEARLTQPNPNERDAFMGMPRKIYDQPAIYRKNRRD